ncbi:FAD-dependent oxidoreductase [Paenibacillaceae bacterium]|nr:FAD-dependent oxidoreductase [Paenibacillaceae bacterium]
MLNETVITDITVIGGGLAGVSAAVAAARQGKQVAFVQNRPVLGGNSSSEVRVWVCGATAHSTHRNARESGIMGEMFIENQFTNPDGNPYLWDLVVLETVRAEPNIQLFLNTDVHEVEATGEEEDRKIHSVTGWMMGSERRIRFESDMFIDCTGDGLVGFLAGAKYRIGREAKAEYKEDWAPEIADNITLGSTLLFYTKDVGQPVKFHPPTFAKDITQTTIPIKRVIRSGDSGCHYWWIEWGGELDTVHDNERIRDELWSVIYGIWDYIKNSGKFDSETMTLEWVGSLPGKREYRRFIGDYVLNQNDILAQEEFVDRIAFGGWSIDLHPPQGMYSTESGSKHQHMDGNYHIPFRSLYSVNVSNLLFAGRNISASHVAFGTTRVMATCAVIGEAAGYGAALAVSNSTTPRGVYEHHLAELQQAMLRGDASLLGVTNQDEQDMARSAQVKTSSYLQKLAVEQSDSATCALEQDIGILLPISSTLETLELLVDAVQQTEITVEVWNTGKPQNYVPHQLETTATTAVPAGLKQWISIPLNWQVTEEQNAFIILRSNKHLALYLAAQYQSGVMLFKNNGAPRAEKNLEDHDAEQKVMQWTMKEFHRQSVCYRLQPDTEAFTPAKLIDGYHRPYGGPHLWISEPLAQDPTPWAELAWDKPVQINEVQITFNDDVHEDLINLHHHRSPFLAIPELVKDYRLEALGADGWSELVRVTDNHRRQRVHRLTTSIQANKLRLVVEATNGASRAEVFEIRVY